MLVVCAFDSISQTLNKSENEPLDPLQLIVLQNSAMEDSQYMMTYTMHLLLNFDWKYLNRIREVKNEVEQYSYQFQNKRDNINVIVEKSIVPSKGIKPKVSLIYYIRNAITIDAIIPSMPTNSLYFSLQI